MKKKNITHVEINSCKDFNPAAYIGFICLYAGNSFVSISDMLFSDNIYFNFNLTLIYKDLRISENM